MNNIEAYICNYTGNNIDVRFFCNSKSSNEFRQLVIERILQQPDIAPLALLRDLFKAETQHSRESWSVNRCVSALASLMLLRGGIEVINDFIDGRYQSFDTYCECGNIDIPISLAQEICTKLIELSALETDANQQKRLQQNIEFFDWLCQKELNLNTAASR